MGRRVYDVVRLIRICTGRDAATFTVRAVNFAVRFNQ